MRVPEGLRLTLLAILCLALGAAPAGASERHPCAECHLSAEAVASGQPLAWTGGIRQARYTPCPALRAMREEVFGAEVRLASMAARLSQLSAAGVQTAPLEQRMEGLVSALGALESAEVRSEGQVAEGTGRLRAGIHEGLCRPATVARSRLLGRQVLGLVALAAIGLVMAAVAGWRSRLLRRAAAGRFTLLRLGRRPEADR